MTQKYLQAFFKICFNWRLLSIRQLEVHNPFRDCRQHILAITIKDKASPHFVKHCDYLFQTHAFLFQLVILVIIVGNLFDLINYNFWILKCINAVISNPLPQIDFKFIDHWLRRWNIFIEIRVFSSRYTRSKFLYMSFRFQISFFRLPLVRCPL